MNSHESLMATLDAAIAQTKKTIADIQEANKSLTQSKISQ